MAEKISVEQRRSLLAPRVVRLAALEHEHFSNQIKKSESDGVDKSQYTTLWMETVNRKNQYKRQSGLNYEEPLEISRTSNAALAKLFRELSGFTWSKNFGWVGQSESLTRPEIDAFAAPSSVFDGVLIERLDAESLLADAAVESLAEASSFANAATSAKVKAAATTAAATAVAAGTVGQVALVALDLSAAGCDGRLLENIGLFDDCKFLNLNMNLIAGPLPRKLNFLTQLRSLQLSSNLLTGTLDAASFSRLVSLTHLDLSFNDFTGEIPDIFAQMSQLQVLNLAGNQLTGQLPPSISCLGSSLIELKLYNNQLTGAVPESFSCLRQLKDVNLSQNRFSSGANSFNCCKQLKTLQLQQNDFHGRIEPSISQLQNLQLLYLQHNQMSGVIPDEICSLSRLHRLNLSHNNFRGCLPHNIGQLVRLQSLLLTGNTIIGPVPRSVSQLINLRDFHVFRAYPSESAMPPIAFDRAAFERIHVFAPQFGIDSMHWDFMQLYGRERDLTDDDTVTLFSGAL